ncbi:hypothetical protein YC2023_068585 [Brassica napus]
MKHVFCSGKENCYLKATKKAKRVQVVEKLEDTNEAGGKSSLDCTLILSQGKSAKTITISGFDLSHTPLSYSNMQQLVFTAVSEYIVYGIVVTKEMFLGLGK